MTKFKARICYKCHVPHVENCPDCFGFGFDDTLHPITAGEAASKIKKWVRCPLCKGTPKGYYK